VYAAEIFSLLSHMRVISRLASTDSQVKIPFSVVVVGVSTPPDLFNVEHVFVDLRDFI
jgi:hypothetical protein